MQKFEVVAQLYIMPHPHLKIVLRLMTHPVDSGGVKGYNVNPLNYSLWFNKRELCIVGLLLFQLLLHAAQHAERVTAILVV